MKETPRDWTAARAGIVMVAMTVCTLSNPAQVQAVTPLEATSDLVNLCSLASPEIPQDFQEDGSSYHYQRRQAIHRVYEAPLRNLDEALLDFDRVTGLMTISGFRRYQARSGAPAIRFRNECILSFEFDEERAHDVVTKIRMGTAELRIGFLVAAHDDYDVQYCDVDGTDERESELVVDLLYARLVDLEGDTDSEVLGTYQTRIGHERALRQSTLMVDAARRVVPEVETSHFQWRPRGQSWRADFEEGEKPQSLDNIQGSLKATLERAFYPCYLRALSRNASLQGALVIEVPFDQTTRGEPRFLMDTLDDEGLRVCIQERLPAIDSVERAEGAQSVDAFKATILFRRR